ncbi:MAG: alpha/beta hydrolase [Verrucomicrobia bacterium]|nr:alpha/beta hydrolase [Verrucomicrobiota bacterium]
MKIFRRESKKLVGVGLGAGLAGALAFALKYALRPARKSLLPESISPAVFATKVLHTTLGHVIYHEAGSGQPLLFVHSVFLGGSSFEWSKVYPEFAGRFRVLAPDLIGFGESQRPAARFAAADYARMLAEFIRATCPGDQPPILVGSGLGAGFCIYLASQHPELVSRLILHMPTGAREFGFGRLRRSTRLAAHLEALQRFLYLNYQSTREAVRNWLAAGFVDASRLTDEVVEVFTTCAQQSGAEYAIRNLHAGRLEFDLEARMSSLKAPVTLIWGSEPGQPSLEFGERLQNAATHCNLVVIPRVGAFAPLEDPAALSAILAEQLDPTLRLLHGDG